MESLGCHPGPMIRPNQALGEVSGYVHLWSRCLHHTSGLGPPDFPAQILKPHRSSRSQPAGCICFVESQADACGQNTKILLLPAGLLPAGFLLQLSHLCTWLLSLVPRCPPARRDQGQPACLAWSKYSKNASTVEATGDETQVRSGPTRQSTFHHDSQVTTPGRGRSHFLPSHRHTL